MSGPLQGRIAKLEALRPDPDFQKVLVTTRHDHETAEEAWIRQNGDVPRPPCKLWVIIDKFSPDCPEAAQ